MVKGVALGFVETRGNTGAVLAIDAMIKTANVEFVKKVEIGSAYVSVVVRGEVGAIRSSVEAGAEAAARVGELVNSNVIPAAHEDIFELIGSEQLEWQALTTGGHGGFYANLKHRDAGTLSLDTELVKADIQIADIGYEDIVFDAGGLGRKIRVFRLPDENLHRQVEIERSIALTTERDNAIYIRIIQQDGHVIWSSPVYVLRGDD